MSAFHLTSEVISAPCFSVVGSCANKNAVRHVGLLAEATSICRGTEVSVNHMAGPVVHLQLPGPMTAHTVGWLSEELSDEDRRCVTQWLEELNKRKSEIFYSPFPAVEYKTDSVSGKRVPSKFSCAGFVQTCFEEALDIVLVVPEEKLPEVNAHTLGSVWGAREVEVAQLRRHLEKPGPWKILLPGYLFHALRCLRAALPYAPAAADPAFA